MKPPIFVDDNGDLLVFGSVEDAARYLEPPVTGLTILDCEGRLLRAFVKNSTVRIAFGLRAPIQQICIEPDEDAPHHQTLLRELITSFLERLPNAQKAAAGVSLDDLVREALRLKIS